MKFKRRLLYGVLEMTFLPGWNWTIDCVRFSGDWAKSIFYLILLYLNHIARSVRIVQNEKLHRLIFHYKVSLYRALEGTSLALICCGDQLWLSSNGLELVGQELPPCWAWRSLPHILLPGVHHSVSCFMVWLESGGQWMKCHSLWLWLLTHQAIMAEQILPVGWIIFWDIHFSCLSPTLLLPIQAGSRLGASLPRWNCMARLQAEVACVTCWLLFSTSSTLWCRMRF